MTAFALICKNQRACMKFDRRFRYSHIKQYSKYRKFDNIHGPKEILDGNGRLWSACRNQKLYSSTVSSQAQVTWRRLLQIQTYGGPTLSRISKAAATVTLALSRSNSHLITPGLLALIAGQFACGTNTLAHAECLPTRSAKNGQLYVTTLALSLKEALILFIRVVYLALLFSPCIAMAPFSDSLGVKFRKTWIHIFHITLERAGPAFIKWGQWAATRPDLFPQDLCTELEKLHTEAPRHDFSFTKRSIEGAFGRKLPEIFEKFEEEPVASGSVAQVHRATLKFRYPGQPTRPVLVAVKVRHPGVGEAIRRDFRIINIAAKISNFIPTLNWLRLDESLQQFAVFMMSQVDLSREAANLSRFIYNFQRSKDVSFPMPLYPLVHPAVLVETYEHGENVMHYVDKLEGNRRVKTALAHIGSSALLKMLLVDNFVHADMHPGNILVRVNRGPGTQLSESKPHVVFLDVGMTAELSKRDRSNLIEFFKAVALREGRTAAECTLRLSKKQKCPNPDAFVEEVGSYFSYWDSPDGKSIHPADCMQQLLELVRRHRVNIDGNVCTVMVTTLVLESWQRKLDPEYNVMQTLQELLFKVDLVESLTYTLEGLASP